MEYKDLVGIPFKYGGRDKSGMDCWGLVVEIYRRMGIEIEDLDYCNKIAFGDNPVFEEHKSEDWERVMPPFKEGDVVLFRLHGAQYPTHCGVYLKGGKVIHAVERHGVVITPIRSLLPKIDSVYRHKCLA